MPPLIVFNLLRKNNATIIITWNAACYKLEVKEFS
jgi:hypothetical protein